MLMEMFILDNGKTIKLMVKGNMSTWMEQNIRVIGSMINNKDKDMKNGQTMLNTLVVIMKVKNMVKENFIGLINHNTMENSIIMK